MPTLHTCCFTDFIPNLFEGQLFQDLKIIAGGDYEGQLAYMHMGKRVPEEFLQKQTDNIAATGAKEVVNEQMVKMKKLMGYDPSVHVNTGNVKKNRNF